MLASYLNAAMAIVLIHIFQATLNIELSTLNSLSILLLPPSVFSLNH